MARSKAAKKDTVSSSVSSPAPVDGVVGATNSPKVSPNVVKRTVTVKVKEHPNAFRYPGSATGDYFHAQVDYMTSLSEGEKELHSLGALVRDPAKVMEFVDTVEVGDVVGVGMNTLEVESKGGMSLVCKNKLLKETGIDVSMMELDEAIGMGYAEILYRDGKPYGVDQTKEVNVTIIGGKGEVDTAASPVLPTSG